MTSPVKTRLKAPLSPLPETDGNPWGDINQVFTSALAGHSAQRRIKGTLVDGVNSGTRSLASWANAWETSTDDNQPLASSSRTQSSVGSSSQGSPKKPTQLLPNGHPLVSRSPSPGNWRRSHEEPRPFPVTSLHNRHRNLSDATEYSDSKDLAWAQLAGSKGKGKMMDDMRDVIVHEVLPSDSLAGVALKYGVELAELRKVNKLWAADTIHLRKTLYIPVDSQKWRSPSSDNLTAVDEEGSGATASKNAIFSEPSGVVTKVESTSGSPIRQSLQIPSNATRRRVPASELSFFPPPTPASRSPKPRSRSPIDRPDQPTPPPNFPSRLSPDLMPTLPTFSPTMLSASLRVLPSYLPSIPGLSASKTPSSEGTSSPPFEDLDVELDNAIDWKRDSSGFAPRAAHTVAGLMQRAGKGRRQKGRLSDIDWKLEVASSSADTIRLYRNDSISNLAPHQVVHTQQPAPVPQMALPWNQRPP